MDFQSGTEASMLPSFFWRKFFVRNGVAGWLPSIKRLLGGGEQYLRYLSDRALAAPVDELLDPAWFPDVQVPDAINLALGAPRCELPLGSLRSVNERGALSAWGLDELRFKVARSRPGPSTIFDPTDEVLI